jgi:starch-binding outer membrane protein SusE/F
MIQTFIDFISRLTVLLLIVVMIACSHELDAPAPLPLETGTLSASKSDVVIDIANPSGEAVTFSWTAPKNTKIDYKLILSSGSASDTVSIQTNTVSKKFSNAELNDILLNELGLEIGEVASVDFVLHAKVTINDKEASSNKVTITVIPSEKGPAYTQLWIVGNATPNGWNINAPNEMVNDKSNIYQFKYNEVLNAGEFKIPVTTGNWGTDYYMPPTNHPNISSTDVALIAGGNPDNKWQIDNAGRYKILLNISSNPFIKIDPFTPYENVYLLGDATTAGWDANNPIVMTVDPDDPNVFTWTGELNSTGEGQFRFPLSIGDLNGNSFGAPSTDASITETQLTFTSGDTPPNNFKVNPGEEGTYKITINQFKETISIVKQ